MSKLIHHAGSYCPRLTHLPGWLALIGLLFSSACSALPLDVLITSTPTVQSLPSPSPTLPPVFPGAQPLQPQPVTPVTFQVFIPEDTPDEEPQVILALRDEVTGLALNSTNYPMQLMDDPDPNSLPTYSLTLTMTVGSAIQYRYERQVDGLQLAEHTTSGEPVRYRLYHVQGPGVVTDTVARWTDTTYDGLTGRITGSARDAINGQPLPDLLVTAGGMQTLTNSDGAFTLEGLPPGTHNLVAFAQDGGYRTFQQGARIEAHAATPSDVQLTPAQMVSVGFVATLPSETPPLVPVRLAGNLSFLGNTFATLSGGINSLAANMPVLTSLGDGRHMLQLMLPAGADIRYKYTLGDGFWNAEHDAQGTFVLRQFIVPEMPAYVEDHVTTWRAGGQGPLSFDITTPVGTPVGDSLSIQFNPLFGWTEALPMWSLGPDRWGYILFSPLPDQLSYRYCRNGQCGVADDAATPGANHPGRVVIVNNQGQAFSDSIQAWQSWESNQAMPEAALADQAPASAAQARDASFLAGVEFAPLYHPSWRSRLPNILDNVQELGGNLLILSPTWTYRLQDPLLVQPVTGQDPTWDEVSAMIVQAQARGQEVALFPVPRFPVPMDEWWASASREYGWWLNWFTLTRDFILHFANLAERNDAEMLILGGEWIKPSLPGGTLKDGSTSGTLVESEDRWRGMIAEVRSRYAGKVLWAINYDDLANPPPFMDAVDGLYVLWSPPLTADPNNLDDLVLETGQLLDEYLLPLQTSLNKPVLVGAGYPSTAGGMSDCFLAAGCPPREALQPTHAGLSALQVDLVVQAELYAALAIAVNQRAWISGVAARGYYPPAALQDASLSIHGKPAAEVLKAWFIGWSLAP